MTKLKDHKGSLADSMETVREVARFADLVRDVQTALAPWGRRVEPADVTLKPYGFDHRIGWDLHIVEVRDYGVYGFTDGPLA